MNARPLSLLLIGVMCVTSLLDVISSADLAIVAIETLECDEDKSIRDNGSAPRGHCFDEGAVPTSFADIVALPRNTVVSSSRQLHLTSLPSLHISRGPPLGCA